MHMDLLTSTQFKKRKGPKGDENTLHSFPFTLLNETNYRPLTITD